MERRTQTLTKFAKDMRKNMTRAEAYLWKILRNEADGTDGFPIILALQVNKSLQFKGSFG
jgi:hypothetical protein